MGDIFTASGTKISIGPSTATTPADATAYAALTPYTEVGLVETLGEYGDESSAVNFAALGDGRMRKGKGARDAGVLQLTVAHDGTDTGQLALNAAEATNNNFVFKVVLPNRLTTGGTDEIQYFKGLVMSKRLNVGGNDNVVRNTYQIAVNSALTTVAAT